MLHSAPIRPWQVATALSGCLVLAHDKVAADAAAGEGLAAARCVLPLIHAHRATGALHSLVVAAELGLPAASSNAESRYPAES